MKNKLVVLEKLKNSSILNHNVFVQENVNSK